MSEYIKISEFRHLIGKRARFKNNLPNYCSFLWLKKGTIKQLHQCKEGDLNHVGLSLVFDEPAKRHKEDHLPMDSCYIAPGSIELLDSCIICKCDITKSESYAFNNNCSRCENEIYTAWIKEGNKEE